MNANVDKLIEYANFYGVFDLAKVVLENYKFSLWPASSQPDKHHHFKGGLAQHTLEVVQLCIINSEYLLKDKQIVVNQKIEDFSRRLFLAALFHDAGKMWDYEPVMESQDYHEGPSANYDKWQSTWRHKRQIHHIARSALVWEDALKNSDFKDPEEEVLHAILAHHGRREWGSPVAPATQMAWILHLCDSLSARNNDYFRFDRF